MLRMLGTITLLLAQALSSWAAEPEWPRFRGRNGEGVVTGADIPASWKAGDFIWKIDLPGVGHGSVAIVGERIFLLCGDLRTSERTVVAVSAKDGRILWQKSYRTAKFKGHRFNSPASTTPAVDNENVYLTWGTKEQLTLTALTHTGEQVWQADLGAIKGGHGFGASPMVHGDLVVINNDQDGESSLVAVDKRTGQKRWEIPRKSVRLSYSVPVVTRDGTLVFTNWQHGFTAVDPKSGKVLSDVSVFNLKKKERAVSSPVLAGDLIIGTCGFTNEPKHAVAMRLKDGRLSEVWRIERNVPHIPCPIVIRDRVYLWEDKGIGTCVDHQTGKVIWRERIGGATYFGSPVSDGKKIFCVDADGVVRCIAATDEFQELGQTDLGELCRSTPAIAHGNLYLRTMTRLFAVRGR